MIDDVSDDNSTHCELAVSKFLADVNSRSRSLNAVAVPSVCLSVVCDVGAPYSAG